jgi:hypothetical protein
MPARKEWKGKKIIVSVSKDEKLHAKREQVEPKLLARDRRLIKLSHSGNVCPPLPCRMVTRCKNI